MTREPQPSFSQIFLSFLKLGCVSFGGPVAHLGYFQDEYVRKRRWLSAAEYADMVALCQFLPGPASSQVGIAIGLRFGGLRGALLAWLGFTLPSAILMVSFALGLSALGNVQGAGWIVGLKLAAVAVVANAVWSMAVTLCPDVERVLIALGSAGVLLWMKNPLWQVGIMLGGAAVGWMFFRNRAVAGVLPSRSAEKKRRGWPYLVVFGVLLVVVPIVAESGSEILVVTEGFYRAGSLVFGGGHVILPLLDSFTVGNGWLNQETFLAGYGAAQALPGPLFAFTAFLGALISVGPGGVWGGVLALVASYLPSWLLVMGVWPYWDKLRAMKSAQAALMGTNAAVVGLLLAAFYDPIWKVGITDGKRLVFAIVALVLLRIAKVAPWLLVILCAAAGCFFFQV